jgi:hypothetical protein
MVEAGEDWNSMWGLWECAGRSEKVVVDGHREGDV